MAKAKEALSKSVASSDETTKKKSEKIILKLEKSGIKLRHSIVRIRSLNVSTKNFQRIIFKVANERKKVVPQSEILSSGDQTKTKVKPAENKLWQQQRQSFTNTTIKLADDITSWNRKIAEISRQITNLTKAANGSALKKGANAEIEHLNKLYAERKKLKKLVRQNFAKLQKKADKIHYRIQKNDQTGHIVLEYEIPSRFTKDLVSRIQQGDKNL